jgi:hypothetical protein
MESSLQIIIAIVGLGTQVVLLTREITKFARDAGPQTVESEGTASSNQTPRASARYKSLLDLSFIILCSAFFSLLTADSLVVSGRPVNSGPLNVFFVFIIAFAYTAILFIAWYISITEKMIGFLAIITLVVLVTSPGGPFDTSQAEGEAGLNVFLVLPVGILITLASTMLIYAYGNPLRRNKGSLLRGVIGSVLIFCTLLAAIALGRQIDNWIAHDERSPQFQEAGKTVARSLTDVDRELKRNFYHLASEIGLRAFYQEQYFQSLQQREEQKNTNEPSNPETDKPASTADKSGPAAKANSLPPSKHRAVTPNANIPVASNANINVSVPEASPRDSTQDDRRQQLQDEYFSLVTNYGEYPMSQALRQRKERIQSELANLRKPAAVSPWVDLLVTKFEGLSPNEKNSFLRFRLYWIHPVGWDSNNESVIPLPALKSEERLLQLAKYRLIRNLYDQEKQRRLLLGSVDLSYPQAVRDFFAETNPRNTFDQPTYVYPDANVQLRKQRAAEFYQRKLFPPKDFIKLQSSNTLTAQLSLPHQEESVIAFKEYQILASEQLKQRMPAQATRIDAWLSQLRKLDSKTQQALSSIFVSPGQNPSSINDTLRLLSTLENSGADFRELLDLKVPLKIQRFSQQIDAEPKNDDLVQPLMAIVRPLRGEDKNILKMLLSNSDNSEFSVELLFRDDVMKILSQVDHDLSTPDEKVEFMTAALDPVWYSIRSLPFKLPKDEQLSEHLLPEKFEAFHNLAVSDQNAVLQQLAISFYEPGGPYSFDPFRLLIAQSHLVSESLGWLTASILTAPFVIGMAILGIYFANLLNKRDRMRDVLMNESAESDIKNTIGIPVELVGRGGTLYTLRNLAERGWSTIGIVGRRGVGKSRILQALVTATPGESSSNTSEFAGVRLWVSSPSKFTEEEFIRSIYERLALSTESAIAFFLNVKPLSARTIENKIAVASGWIYAGAIFLFGIVIYYMSTRLTRIDIVVIWIPIIGLLCTSMILFVNYLTKLQPINLTSWLQRSRDQNPHTYLLYRDVYSVLESLRLQSIQSQNESSIAGMMGVGRSLVLGLLSILVTIGAIWILSLTFLSPAGQDDPFFLVASIVAVLACAFLWLTFFRKPERRDLSGASSGSSLMSLIAEYRVFASSVVDRLQAGALNVKPGEKFVVLVCIDELDKIVDFEEIRSFIRRVKAIFEVPGLYYYISIAEDTIRALYLGPAAGKNEVDSAFDHIVRIGPLSVADGEEVATNYLRRNLGTDDLPKNIGKAVAAIAFGLPRDVIRRCDEFVSENKDRKHENAGAPNVTDFIRKYRLRQLDLGYELQHLSLRELVGMRSSSPFESAAAAKAAIATVIDREADSRTRLLLFIWTLAMIESIFSGPNRKHSALDRLASFGYRVSDAAIQDLLTEVEQLHQTVFDKQMSQPQGTVPYDQIT